MFDFPPTPPTPKINLQPLTFSQVVTLTLQIYRTHWRKFLVLIFPVAVISIVAGLIATGYGVQRLTGSGLDFNDPAALRLLTQDQINQYFGAFISFLVVIAVVALITGFFYTVVVNSIITYVASESILGRVAGIGAAFRAVRSRFGAVTAGYLLLWVLLVALTLALAVILFACGLGLGLIVYITIILGSFLTPLLVLERVGPLEGLKRTWHLAKRRFWAIVGVYALVFLVSLLESVIASVFRSQLVVSLTGLVFSLVIAPVTPIAYTILYYDARVRFENLTEALNRVEKLDPRPADVPSPNITAPAMQQGDFVNLALVTVGLVVLVVLYYVFFFAVFGSSLRLPGGLT